MSSLGDEPMKLDLASEVSRLKEELVRRDLLEENIRLKAELAQRDFLDEIARLKHMVANHSVPDPTGPLILAVPALGQAFCGGFSVPDDYGRTV